MMKKTIASLLIASGIVGFMNFGSLDMPDSVDVGRHEPPKGDSRPIDIDNASRSHNCRLWGSISNAMPPGVLYDNLVTYPNSLKYISYIGNNDGWGISWITEFGGPTTSGRAALSAFFDSTYDSQVASIDSSVAPIVIAHVRDCNSGCCCPGCFTIPDPHPFSREKNGLAWIFAHNGSVNKSSLIDLIGQEYLADNPPTGSGVPECDPSDSSLVTDSELYFILLLKHIEQNSWNVFEGLQQALIELIYREPGSELNFVLTDGNEIWAFRRFNTLYYIDDIGNNYKAVSSEFPTFYQEQWIRLFDYELIRLTVDEPPQIYDLRGDLPPIAFCPGDTSLLYIETRPVCLSGFTFEDPDSNIDTIVVNVGVYDGKKLCFNPHEGANAIVFTAIDTYGGSSTCSTTIEAILTDPGAIAGAVLDSLNFPLPDVEIELMTADISDSTNAQGYYNIENLVPGFYDIKFSHEGFMDTTVDNVPINPNETTTLNISLRAGCRYVVGDANGNGAFNGIDVSYSVNYLKGLGDPPSEICVCPYHGSLFAAADANGDCRFNGLDVIYSVNYLKGWGRRPSGCPDCPPVP